MKKAVAIMLMVTFISAIFWVVNPLTPVYAEEYRNGFLLIPVDADATGIYTDTEFILKTEKDYTAAQVKEMITLLEENPLAISSNTPREFLVKPQKEFESNQLYTFVITTPENETVSWTFQTCRDFTILGTLPGNQSSYVPVNSGIEIYFSHTEFGDLQKYFEISPKVEGRFERNGHIAVFVPKELEHGTVYTVTVKKELPLEGTVRMLPKDYVFAFETEPAPEESANAQKKGSLYFRDILMEFATNKAPLIPLDIYYGENRETEAVVKTTIYRYESTRDFIEALKTKYEQPYWAYSVQQKNLLSNGDLIKIASFEQTFDLTQWQQRYLSVPESLSNGFYLVESTYNGLTAQMLIQSTNLSAYFTESDTKTLIWVNSLKSGKSVTGAEVSFSGVDKSFSTDAEGIAAFDTIAREPDEETGYEMQYYLVESGKEKVILITNPYGIYRYDSYAQDHYWRYFQTDRNLYKPDDPVQFWGFLQNRYDGTSPETITVEISEGRYWGVPGAKFLRYFLPSIQKPLLSVDLTTENGFFEGGFQLPKLSPGSYQITVKVNDEIINSHFIQIENYVKPAYKMTVEKDKNAIFLGETVNFTIIPSFFDGTPLPSLDISYNIGGYPFQEKSHTKKTGSDGTLTIPFTATTDNDTAQGEQHVWLNVNATLPESGMIRGNNHVRVFINDIQATFRSEGDEAGNITLEATLNEIVLDRLNNPKAGETQNNSDFLGDPVAYKTLSGTIMYHTYEKIEDGEEYDYINKVVKKKYRYEKREEKVKGFSFRTGEDGIATETFTLEHPNEGWYTAELIWNDNSGRSMHREVYLSNRQYISPPDEQNDWYHLEADEEKYRLNDEVTVTLKNNEEIVSKGSVLFFESQKGITRYAVQDHGEYKTIFTEDIVPNFYIHGVYFTGETYIQAGSRNIRYDTDEVKLEIAMEADRESYHPGDTVTLMITAKDENGKPIAAHINLALIDEAMLAISGYDIDVLSTLYQWLGSGVGYSDSTHGTNYYGIRAAYGGLGGMNMAIAEDAVQPAAKMAVEFDEENTAAMDSVQVRSEFKDTAFFRQTILDEEGFGTVSFKLPDNVTSWHVYMAGISSDLHGGTGEADLMVSLPFFINDSLNTTYLSGDFPYIGVTGYGNDLEEGECITWQVTSPQNPNYTGTATSKAFERINIPLWQLEEGIYDIEIKAISGQGLSDGIKRTIYVTDTYHEIEKAVTETLQAHMQLTGGNDGLTTLIFTDAGRGQLIPPLYGLLYAGGSRLDQTYTAYRAKQLLNTIVPDRKTPYDANEADLSQYQKTDGGFGILPYSESDPELSALLSSLLKDESGAGLLKQYFYSLIFSEPGRANTPALYGLAAMREPVLVDLNKALTVQNLSLRDNIYLALAFESLGETQVSQWLYEEKVKPVLEEESPYIRVANSNDTDIMLRDTALAAVLASKLNIPDKDGLFRYVTDNYSEKILVNAEKLLYIINEYQKLPAGDVKFTYEYDGNTYTETLKDGSGVTVNIPSAKLSEVKITDVSGEGTVVSVFKAPLSGQAKQDETLQVQRTYYNYATGEESVEFRQNDIVKVVLEWDIAKTAMDSHYEITDYAPSGLKPIESPYQAGIRPEKGTIWWFRNTDGQKVTFNVHRDSKTKEPLVYYARVVNPGSFTADSTIMQGTLVKDSLQFGESIMITITDS